MTLRATIEIVPYGIEAQAYKLFKLGISNIEELRDEGFGHVICKYEVKVYRHLNETTRNLMKVEDEWEYLLTEYVDEHDRRDGSIALVAKAAKLVEEKV